jgi:hypothetical protein
MPIVIDEVEITIITPEPNTGGLTAAGSANPPNTDELVKICVEKVLEVLHQKMER